MREHEKSRYAMVAFGFSLLLATTGAALALEPDEEDYDLKLLGKYVFFDKISNPSRMACVTCHDPDTGGTGSISGVNQHDVAITGANPHTIGNLKPPTNAYASFIEPLHSGCPDGVPGICGGNFWNGRSEGGFPPVFPAGATRHIGDEVFQDVPVGHQAHGYDKYFGPTSDQALNPMPNPVEQNIERQAVCEHVASAKYAELYEIAWGVAIDCSNAVVAVSAPDLDPGEQETEFDISFKRIMLAVGAWQHSKELNSFSSKRDIALRAELACVAGDPDADPAVCSDPNYLNSPGEFPLVGLTDQENLGHDLFYNTIQNVNPDIPVANCAFCHADNTRSAAGADGDTGAEPEQLYADDAFHNIGVPRNPEIPASFDASGALIDPDLGLKGLTGQERHRGFHKTPTIRNVDKRKGKGFTKAYTHNGWFKSLESLVHFYNTAAIGLPTANSFGITRCPEGIETEKDALAHNCWPAPAVSGNGPGSPAFPFLLGDLRMNRDQEAAIVAYMKSLTDTFTVQQPKPYKSH